MLLVESTVVGKGKRIGVWNNPFEPQLGCDAFGVQVHKQGTNSLQSATKRAALTSGRKWEKNEIKGRKVRWLSSSINCQIHKQRANHSSIIRRCCYIGEKERENERGGKNDDVF